MFKAEQRADNKNTVCKLRQEDGCVGHLNTSTQAWRAHHCYSRWPKMATKINSFYLKGNIIEPPIIEKQELHSTTSNT